MAGEGPSPVAFDGSNGYPCPSRTHCSTGRDGYRVIELGLAYPRVRQALRRLERMVGATLIGFGDMTVEDIVRVTGLARLDAERARQREYDEPFLLESSPLSLEGVRKAARQLGLAVISGGQCHHLVGGTDKGRACRLLIELYRKYRKEWGTLPRLALAMV